MKSHLVMSRMGSCWVLAVLALSSQDPQAQDDAVHLDEIRASWRESAAAYETASFTWTRESLKLSRDGIQLNPPVPIVSSYRIILSGDSTYQESDIETYVHKDRAAKPLPGGIDVFHDLEARSYMPYAGPNGRGSISRDHPQLDMTVGPLLIGWFLKEPPFLYDEHYEILRMTTEDGSRFAVVGNTDFDDPKYSGATRREYKLSEELGWAPTSFRLMYPDGEVRLEYGVEYSGNEELGNIPSEITITIMSRIDHDMVDSHATINLSDVEVNIPVDPAIFEFEFPSGTSVDNAIMNFEYIAGRGPRLAKLDEYVDTMIAEVSAADTSTEEVAPIPPGGPHTEPDTPPGKPEEPSSGVPLSSVAFGLVAVLAPLTALYAYRSYKKRNPQVNP